MLWLLMALFVIVGGVMMLRRKAEFVTGEDEPWRQSLREDEPLDIDEIRRVEEEWSETAEWEDLPEDESWR
jgi:hypothetical protein